MYKDIMTVSVVTFHPEWSAKEKNLNRILGYIECAAKRGSDLIVFPEMALTSYDDMPNTPREEKMQTLLAEPLPGPSSDQIARLSQQYGIYILLGMPERSTESAKTVYNSLAAFGPTGLVGAYRKMHLPNPEPNWATRGDTPMLLDTPWGPIGLTICYDIYCFPEMLRYYTAKGARLIINSTALGKCHGSQLGSSSLESNALINGVFIATANLGGPDKSNYFWGGSSIIGPSCKRSATHYYAGLPFTAPHADEESMYTATIDLSLASRMLVKYNPAVGSPNFRPEKYIAMYQELLQQPDFKKQS